MLKVLPGFAPIIPCEAFSSAECKSDLAYRDVGTMPPALVQRIWVRNRSIGAYSAAA